ncbi:adenosine deaminase [Tomitella biformata]|uniref:adenosine deaminase n=1 Tax=Tomitella biformata TaxID=630403 RepID=UPI000467D002|nr:adenosine deaminase [Tomitella biformata]
MAATGPTPIDDRALRTAPKVLLHDHLDGGLRPQTVLDLARKHGYRDLPCDDGPALAAWFRTAADSGSLEKYLETFAHTVGVMQHRDALIRVARECALDLAADGVVYAEVRFAPELHIRAGLELDEVIEAVLEGFEQGCAEAAIPSAPGHQSPGHPSPGLPGRRLRVGALLTAMRQAARSREIAELAVRYRDRGVVGFDIAGAEAGHPPTRHLDAFEYMRQANAHFTIHAGEAFGLPSIHEAIAFCGADRLGHGVRITDDIAVPDLLDWHADAPPEHRPVLGLVANYVRDKRIPLELCPSSNVQTGAAPSLDKHPFDLLARLRFRVTVNTDNRLMSDTTMSREMAKLVDTFGYDWLDLRRFTVNAAKSAFIPFDQRLALIDDIINPGYEVLFG